MLKRAVLALAALGACGTVAAASDSEWTGEAEFGVLWTTGNTDTQQVIGKLTVENDREKWRHDGLVAAINASQDGSTNAERYRAEARSNYKLTSYSYIFGRLNYENDRFSGYNYRVSEVIGYGRRVLDTGKFTLDLEAGPGLRQAELSTGESENNFILWGGGDFAWTISDTTQFTQELDTEIGSDATITSAVTTLQTRILGNLASNLTYSVRHISDVPADTDKTDTITAISLIYSF